MPARRARRLDPRPVERADVSVLGLADALRDEGLQSYLRSANFMIERLGSTAPLVASIVRFPELTFTDVRVPEITIAWPRDHVSAGGGLILIAATGGVTVDTGGHWISRGASVTLIPPGCEHVRIRTTAVHNEIVYISFAADLLSEFAVPPPAWDAYAPIEWAVLAPFYSFVHSLCSVPASGEESAGALAVAARAVVRELLGIVTRTQPRDAPFEAAMAIIERGFADPTLSVVRIARRLRISTRSLQALFTARGTTVSVELRRVRARTARLAHASNPRATSREVAAMSGFGSVSALYRALRSEGVRDEE